MKYLVNILLPVILYSQNTGIISGTIIDMKSGDGMPGVNVIAQPHKIKIVRVLPPPKGPPCEAAGRVTPPDITTTFPASPSTKVREECVPDKGSDCISLILPLSSRISPDTVIP